MKHLGIVPVMALALAGPAAAQGFVYASDEGHQYRYARNDNGAVLTSLYPVVRFIGSGAMTQEVTGIETLYLGRGCDAWSEALGSGSWAWANGGFLVRFGEKHIAFPRQEIDANSGLNCEMP